jgi:hypothetical protein
MSEQNEFKENSPAVQAHLNISQAVIQRMASNSASCKTYCITIVSAILVLVADKGKPEYLLVATMPTALFFTLDVYYLALERMFRNSYNLFIGKLHAGNITAVDLFAVLPSGRLWKSMPKAMISFSIWPFYLVLVITELVAKYIIV